MSAKDHPNIAPGVPMLFPPWLERLQLKYVDPVMTPIAKRLPGFTAIKHRGRTSGRAYETIVTSYRKGNVFAVILAHGKTNWVKNVLAAGGADVKLFRGELKITNPQILPAGSDDPSLPLMARLAAKKAGVLVAEIV
ncbi:nitroreductase family deazaflavin-dependent oxidoreductase [Mycolicibacterium goodii]|uniref:nitroreductase family deazaflavin-dependent oxidoreductase n=1 Tax=Mycolicibacterium goodii TaxID=134601 RepID=UPI00093D4F09|nr:nitroreductase family deazaflavin-dependent oxidoreductase [Mycolicibacterium goodii]MBU8811608.1 nitroreductase family deazaflavin-dependent oxidoreductase [Mycolicibacterium goodii]MBU8828629.1 nitroreductase family deazaflavin-dependent oxidoreductase [Mycolicibacterium goodii]OKH70471.1 nitroreductase [Mycobacterium sp. SWH-M5]ULN50580.1 nitroreductase family deazaflavin-dependent oxidoreductase [Mycolicibacterium goodii]